MIILHSFDVSSFHKMKTRCFVHRNYQKFVTYAESLLTDYPKQDEIWLSIADAYHYLDDEEKVIQTLKKYLTRKKTKDAFHNTIMLLGGKRRQRSRRRHLIPEITQYYRFLSDSPDFYSRELCYYYLSVRDYQAATQEMVKAINLDPKNLSDLSAKFFNFFGKTDSIVLVDLIESSKHSRGRNLLLAMIALRRGKYLDASYDFKKYSYYDGLFAVSESLISYDRLDETAKIIKDMEKDDVDRNKLARLYLKIGNYQKTLDLTEDPIIKAECYIQLGQFQKVIDILSNARNNTDAKRLYCYALVGLEDFNKAVDYLKENKRSDELNLLLAELYLARSNPKASYDIVARTGQRTQSLSANDALYLRIIIEKANFDTITLGHYARASLYSRISGYKKARDELVVINENNPIFEYVMVLLAKIYCDQGEFKWAKIGLDKARQVKPETPIMPRILYLQINILKKMGEKRESEAITDTLLADYPNSPEAQSLRSHHR